jgi:hypothetical protein
VAVVGFTWYGLVDMTDWDVALRERRGTVNPVGLFDLDRRERPVAAAFRRLVRDYGHVEAWDSALTILEHIEPTPVEAGGDDEPGEGLEDVALDAL